ncbi:hypothetical protein WS62_26560 [Burkholderia sp. ABCPW 14]|uniref:hypothetical protein n=1 Tax=Burkholderia sp. ABCPW 14 TaxID=1637860 RepID=UPI000770E320|nr:hypothetical protein [Burkholderia sp. ABCPW 14]KVD80616.1 hypothetical protein WS62_26560 [Burkholderia sp. ABCPW 14]
MQYEPHTRSPILTVPIHAALRPVIDEVVHRSVSEATTKDGYMRCADYAIVGARLLSMLTGARYRPVAGGEVMDFGEHNLFVLCSTRERRRAAKHLSQLARYHCWIEASHTDADGLARTEIVDFTMRHDAMVATMVGMSFARPHQAYFWGWEDEHAVPAELRDHPAFAKQGPYWRWAERECTALLRAYERERPSYFGRQVSRALNLLADRIERDV